MSGFGSIFAAARCCAPALMAFPARSLAYLDPGTGSYLVQLLLAGLLAAGLAIRLFWHNISDLVRRVFSRDKAGGGTADGA